jgi:glutamine synthetase
VIADDADPTGCVDRVRAFLAGQLAHMRELTLLFAPNINSYKRSRRLVRADAIKWGRDNRTCALRARRPRPGLRLENRVPGRRRQPLPRGRGMIAAGLDGIERELELEPAFGGNAYDSDGRPGARRPSRGRCGSGRAARGCARPSARRSSTTTRTWAGSSSTPSAAAVTDWERFRGFERM